MALFCDKSIFNKGIQSVGIMQVVVLAGGVGSRLRPWTTKIPKPLLKMLDKTLLERVVECMPENLVDEVIVAGGYKVDHIQEYFKANEVDFDVRIVRETEPLGTGGALGNCRDIASGTFACFNGDIISSLNAESLVNLHQSNGGIGTLGLWEVEDPTRFGIVGLDENSKITRFKEKPKPEEVFSNLINAGSYILEEDIFSYMPLGRHSLERDVFPKLAEENQLNGKQFKGYFIDAGTPSAWMEGVKTCISQNRFKTGRVSGNSWFEQFESCTLDKSTLQSSMIQSGVKITDAEVRSTTLLRDSRVDSKAKVTNCLIGEGAVILEGAELDGVVVDHGAQVPANHLQVGGQWPPN